MAEADPAYRLAALQALATGGTQAKAALDQTRAQLASSQQAATSQAMSAAAQYGLGTTGEQALTEPINRAYNAASTTMDKVAAPRLARFETLKEPTAKMFDAKAAAILAGKSSGGGSRGGGGSGGSSKAAKEPDWFEPYRNDFGTVSQFAKYVQAQSGVLPAAGSGLGYLKGRQLLSDAGAPPNIAAQYFPMSKQALATSAAVQGAAKKNMTPAQVKKNLQQDYGKNNPAVGYWLSQYRSLRSG